MGVGEGVGVVITPADPGQVCERRIPELIVLVAANVPACTILSFADVGVYT